MGRCNIRKWLKAAKIEAGMTLVEVLVAAPIYLILVGLAVPLPIMLMQDQKVLTDLTARYESLRLPASFFTQDVRFAVDCSIVDRELILEGVTYPIQSLRLTEESGRLIEYTFFDYVDGEVVQDPTNLHRWEGPKGGDGSPVPESDDDDDIVGQNLVSYSDDPFADITGFSCAKTKEPTAGFYSTFDASLKLVTYANKEKTRTAALYVVAYPRQRPVG